MSEVFYKTDRQSSVLVELQDFICMVSRNIIKITLHTSYSEPTPFVLHTHLVSIHAAEHRTIEYVTNDGSVYSRTQPRDGSSINLLATTISLSQLATLASLQVHNHVPHARIAFVVIHPLNRCLLENVYSANRNYCTDQTTVLPKTFRENVGLAL